MITFLSNFNPWSQPGNQQEPNFSEDSEKKNPSLSECSEELMSSILSDNGNEDHWSSQITQSENRITAKKRKNAASQIDPIVKPYKKMAKTWCNPNALNRMTTTERHAFFEKTNNLVNKINSKREDELESKNYGNIFLPKKIQKLVIKEINSYFTQLELDNEKIEKIAEFIAENTGFASDGMIGAFKTFENLDDSISSIDHQWQHLNAKELVIIKEIGKSALEKINDKKFNYHQLDTDLDKIIYSQLDSTDLLALSETSMNNRSRTENEIKNRFKIKEEHLLNLYFKSEENKKFAVNTIIEELNNNFGDNLTSIIRDIMIILKQNHGHEYDNKFHFLQFRDPNSLMTKFNIKLFFNAFFGGDACKSIRRLGLDSSLFGLFYVDFPVELFPNLDYLFLKYFKIDENFLNISKNIKHLSLQDCRIKTFDFLHNLPNLEHFELSMDLIHYESTTEEKKALFLAAIDKNLCLRKTLKKLDLYCNLDNDFFMHLNKFENLEDLKLSRIENLDFLNHTPKLQDTLQTINLIDHHKFLENISGLLSLKNLKKVSLPESFNKQNQIQPLLDKGIVVDFH